VTGRDGPVRRVSAALQALAVLSAAALGAAFAAPAHAAPALAARLAPANGPVPGDDAVAALWCFGALGALGAGWALLRAVRARRLKRQGRTSSVSDLPAAGRGRAGPRRRDSDRP